MNVSCVRLSFVVCLVVCACASRPNYERLRPLVGQWKTDKNIVMSIHSSPDGSFVAEILKAPGYLGEDYHVGRMMISNIEPLVDGGYRGLFLMPNGETVHVRMNFTNSETLLIAMWDIKNMGAAMRWRRIRNDSPDYVK